MGRLEEEPQGVQGRDRAQEPFPAIQRHEPGHREWLWEGAAWSSPSPRPPRCSTAGGAEAAYGIQRLPETGISPETRQRPAQVIVRLQEGRGMPSRETRGEFPALCGGEDWEEVQAELDRERRNPTANTPSAPGAAPVRRRPPHPRRRLALEGKGKAGHTLHLPLPGTATAARREPGGRWKVPSPCRGWLQHRSCAGRGPVYLWCRCTSDWRHAPLRGRPRSSCSASRRRVAPCWRQPCRSSSFRCVCSLPDAPSGCGTHRRALPLYPSRVPVSQTSPRRRDDSVAGAGRCPL